MKVKFCLESGANHQSANKQTLDLDEIGFTENEWKALDEEGKHEMAVKYFQEQGYPEIWFEEIEE